MCVCVCLCVINYHYANFLPSKLKLCFLTFFLRQPEEMTTNTVAWQSAGILLDHSRNTDHPLLFNELLSALPSLIQIWPGKKKKKRLEEQKISVGVWIQPVLTTSHFLSMPLITFRTLISWILLCLGPCTVSIYIFFLTFSEEPYK